MINDKKRQNTTAGRAKRSWLRSATALLGAGLLFTGLVWTQEVPDDDAIWKAFIGWFRSAPPESDLFGTYAAKLGEEGAPATEVRRRLAAIVRLFSERPEGVEVYYDRAFSRPITGDPAQDVPRAPSAFVVQAVKGLKPGAALDLGTGQGRNAVHLAREGWDVTGLDISQVALDVARTNAVKSGVSIRTEKAAYDTFDFGVEKWDLIAIVFAWAPVSDPGFVAKLRTSLRPGGVVLFEHFVDNPEDPCAPMVRALKPNELRGCFSGFDLLSYAETEGTGDWGGPGSRLVRMAARKRF
jgi:SAM-dependent methyltransferase